MLSIGELAGATGVKIPTIRYYEKIGLLRTPPRSDGRQRRYDAEALRQLEFVRHARGLGFDVEDIRELLALSAQPQQPCDNADKIATRHLAAVEQRIRQLTALKRELKQMLDDCRGGCVAECRVIESLATPAAR